MLRASQSNPHYLLSCLMTRNLHVYCPAAMILGGGSGTDLWPLTNSRAEPAVPFAGLFRLIDVPLSNCIHSGISNIYVLTQYNATRCAACCCQSCHGWAVEQQHSVG
jgi:dTDP-glucose pyrophosphorylase